MKSRYLKAKQAYYNDNPVMTDAEFDALEDAIRKKDPSWAELAKTGAPVSNKKTEVRLREFMPSLAKAYPENIDKWIKKNPSEHYVVMDKLDGSSLQVVYNKGRLTQVVTRGDGTLGGDITFLSQYLNLPPTIGSKSLTIFRCEAIITKARFKKWASEFDNPRNMVNGILNRRTPHKALKDVDIVVLGCFGLSIKAGLNLAKLEGLEVVNHTVQSVYAEKLPLRLQKRIAQSYYEMDGLVIVPNSFEFKYANADKPKNAIAFKVNTEEQTVKATVKAVVWQTSRYGTLIPKIEIEPQRIGDVTVTYCTAHNAQWMKERKIGPGAVVKLVRSGGVIPKIVGVVKGSKFSPPKVSYEASGVHLKVLDTAGVTEIEVKRIATFFKTLGIEYISDKTIAKVFPAFPSIKTYLRAARKKTLLKDLQGAGLGSVMSAKIAMEITREVSDPISMKTVMVATAAFGNGIGERKLSSLEAGGISMVDLTDAASGKTQASLKARVLALKGWSTSSWDKLKTGLPLWGVTYKELSPYIVLDGTLPKAKKKSKGKLSNELVSFTGYRDSSQEAAIEAAGGQIVPFGSKTTILLIKDGGKLSSKVEKARAKGIRVGKFEQLM